jgi:uncharacterized protein YkwD
MLAAVNQLRASVGSSPLTLCEPISRAAQFYAALMADSNYYGHVGPDGSQAWDRMSAQGYAWRGAGENIAGGYDSVNAVMAGWEKSPGHYKNLVNPDFTHVGFGSATAPSSRYGTYWVQNFGYGGRC